MRTNIPSRRNVPHFGKTTNYDGNVAYKMPPKVDLLTRVATCFWKEPKFYGDSAKQSEELITLMENVADTDPEYVYRLAAYARNVLNLRTVSVVLFVVASNSDKAKDNALARKYAPGVILRADEIAEALAFQISWKGSKKAMPNNLRRALADSFNRFNAYQLSKYSALRPPLLAIAHPERRLKTENTGCLNE